jgi:hypothetical protein
MVDLDFESKFRHCVKKIEEVGILYAEAKGQSWQMQEMRSSVLAKLIREQGEIPVSKAEILAKASPAYEDYILSTSQAITKVLKH